MKITRMLKYRGFTVIIYDNGDARHWFPFEYKVIFPRNYAVFAGTKSVRDRLSMRTIKSSFQQAIYEVDFHREIMETKGIK